MAILGLQIMSWVSLEEECSMHGWMGGSQGALSCTTRLWTSGGDQACNARGSCFTFNLVHGLQRTPVVSPPINMKENNRFNSSLPWIHWIKLNRFKCSWFSMKNYHFSAIYQLTYPESERKPALVCGRAWTDNTKWGGACQEKEIKQREAKHTLPSWRREIQYPSVYDHCDRQDSKGTVQSSLLQNIWASALVGPNAEVFSLILQSMLFMQHSVILDWRIWHAGQRHTSPGQYSYIEPCIKAPELDKMQTKNYT